MIDGKSINQFHFKEYLIDVLIKRSTTISEIAIKLLSTYSGELFQLWVNILEHVSLNIPEGEIIELDNYIKHKVNGEFTEIIKQFVFDYEKSSN